MAQAADASTPVTILVRRKVKPGREKDYEAWLERLTRGAAEHFQGYRGAEFRRQMLAEAAPLFAGDAAWERMTGLEFWFDPPPGTKVPQPSPHRMALVLIAVVFCLVLILNLALGPLMTGWPLPLRVLATVTLQVVLMTYLIMPRLTPLIAHFVYPKTITL